MGKPLFLFLGILFGLSACADRPRPFAREESLSFQQMMPIRRAYGQYQVPYLVRRFPVPDGMEGKLTVTLGEVRRQVGASPVVVRKVSSWPPEAVPLVEPAPEEDRWYRVQETAGEILVTFFPQRYDHSTKENLTLASAVVRIEWAASSRVQSAAPSEGAADSAEALIVVPAKWKKTAAEIEQIHREWGTHSEVVTVESVREGEPSLPGDEAVPAGGEKYFRLTNGARLYDAALAAKLGRYLRGRIQASGKIKAILLLGGAEAIPPSRYFHFETRRRWLPTDLCYAESACMPGKVAVGRLPFQSIEDWATYLKKLAVWVSTAVPSAGALVSLAGSAFPGPVFVGEAAALHITESLPTTWDSVEKLHRSRGQYTESAVREALAGALQKPYLLHFDHGEGNEVRFDSLSLTSKPLRELPAGKLPYLMMSMACANAAYDAGLVTEPLYKKEDGGNESVAEALLASRAGAVAYVGSLRRAVGDPDYAVDDSGNLLTKDGSYGVDLLTIFAKQLGQTPHRRLGEVYSRALREYAYERGLGPKDVYARWTWMNFGLLGDPLLPLAAQGKKRKGGWSAVSTGQYDREALGLPFHMIGGGAVPYSAKVARGSRAQLVRVTAVGATSLDEKKEDGPDVAWTVPIDKMAEGDRLLVRWENRESPYEERQTWVEIRERKRQ